MLAYLPELPPLRCFASRDSGLSLTPSLRVQILNEPSIRLSAVREVWRESGAPLPSGLPHG